MSLAWLVAYAVVWSVFTAIAVYVVSAEGSSSHVEHAVVICGFLMLAAGSRAVLGQHAARAAGWAFAPMALFFYGSSQNAQNAILFGMGDWCGTGRLSSAMFYAMLALPMGGLAVALLLLFRRFPSRASASPPPRAFVVQALAVGALGLSIVGTISAVTRPAPSRLRAAMQEVETVKVWPPSNHEIPNESGHPLRVVCMAGAEFTPARKEGSCSIELGASPHASGTRAGASHWMLGDERVVISRHPTEDVWSFEVKHGADEPPAPFAMLFEGEVRSSLLVEDAPGRFGPSFVVVAFSWAAALVIGAFGWWWSRMRSRVAQILEGREATLDEQGHVVIDGTQHLLDPALRRDGVSGAVVVLRAAEREGYRDTNTVTALVRGTKAELAERADAERREWRSVALTTAVLLVMPLLAAASLGLI